MSKKNNSAKERAGFMERIGRELDIDCDMICRGFGVEMRGRTRAEICGARRILIYTDSQISFVTPEGIFSVLGKHLSCVSYKRGTVIVEGRLTHMGFEIGENDERT